VLATLGALGFGVAAGCGGAGAKEDGEVTIVVTSRGYTEEKLLREIYAHALEAVGFEVKRRDDPRMLPPEELEKGRISGYPDHLETALTEVTPTKLEDVPGSAATAYREAKRRLGARGFVPFPPLSFGRASAVAVSRKAAEERDLQTLSDLKGPSHRMSVVEGEYFCYCHGPVCLESLEREYGIAFEAFSVAEPQRRLYKTLRKGEADAAVVLTSEGRLARSRWFVLLEDDQHRLPASNALWLTSQKVIDEAGPDYERAIIAAQKGLTLDVMRELNAGIELEGKTPGEVAAKYLESIDHAH
jgi:osmoprotectant transport system substrate-binding protein